MTEKVDFAIVGGGASGIYSAWRLAHATEQEQARIRESIGGTGPLRIALYEMSGRIGGRLLSASPKRLPDVPMEVGGMRYLDDHVLVKSLVETKLCLGTHIQTVDSPENLAWLRRRRFRAKELGQPYTDLPYTLTWAERDYLTTPNPDGSPKTPADLIFWAVYREFPELDGMAPDRIRPWLQTEAKVDGQPLYQIGFWNLLARHLSNEGRTLALKTVGYDSLGANANAVDIIAENLAFTPTSKYHLFDEGFETVLWELESQFLDAGGEIHFGEELESFDHDDKVHLTFHGDRRVEARAIVLGLPQAALRQLRKVGPVMDPNRSPHMQSLLTSVTSVPLYKLFVVYDRPWWHENDSNLVAGRSVTDLPVRQCYYWTTNPGGPSAIMAYNDEASVSFWGGYQRGPQGPDDTRETPLPFHVPLFEATGNPEVLASSEIVARRLANWEAHKAPKEMVHEMHRQIMELHGVSTAPEPVDAAFMDWANPPFGGAVHFWNAGRRSWEDKLAMIQPVADVPAYVVGESWSTVQTWVEGAFQTSELFLARLGMAPPPWVPERTS